MGDPQRGEVRDPPFEREPIDDDALSRTSNLHPGQPGRTAARHPDFERPPLLYRTAPVHYVVPRERRQTLNDWKISWKIADLLDLPHRALRLRVSRRKGAGHSAGGESRTARA